MLKNKTNNKYSTSIFVSQSMGNFETLEHFIQIAKRFDSLNEQMSPTNDHFKRHSVTYE